METPDPAPAEPLGLLRRWLAEATTPDGDPPAAVLATAGRDGRPSTRTIEVRGCDDRGLVFFANLDTRKGRDLREQPAAAATFYWPATIRQLNLTGDVVFTDPAESDRLWATRSPAGQAVATLSEQGAPLPDETTLRARVTALAAAGRSLPRPPGHGGFVLIPVTIEFWLGRPDRFHHRLHYQRAGQRWSHWLLQP
ncbi:MAG TPA: pyridoxal 5'-phosphate synthase [Streptosporangiaceae bacterium]